MYQNIYHASSIASEKRGNGFLGLLNPKNLNLDADAPPDNAHSLFLEKITTNFFLSNF
jgi:hypothetical protein